MRADKRSGGASIEMLKTARHTASRQNAKRSRSGIASVDQVIRDGRFGDALGSRVALSTNLLALPPKIAGTGRCSWAHRNACPDEARGRAVPLYLPFQIKSLAKIGLRLHDLVNEVMCQYGKTAFAVCARPPTRCSVSAVARGSFLPALVAVFRAGVSHITMGRARRAYNPSFR